MLASIHHSVVSRAQRLRRRLGERTAGALLALLVEGLFVLVVLSLGWTPDQPKKKFVSLVSFAVPGPKEAKPEPEAAKPAAAKSPELQRAPRSPVPAVVPPIPAVAPVTPPPAIIPLSRSQMAVFDISRMPRQPGVAPAPARAMMGPADTGGGPTDSKRVGTAPGGQPLYAAAWYREPYDDELRGYLSTASGPGWALIACRTVSDFRVEDCVGLDEYPSGSSLQRAVLAAAWQFRVRPPRLGGVYKVGEWVRIRIDYEVRRQ